MRKLHAHLYGMAINNPVFLEIQYMQYPYLYLAALPDEVKHIITDALTLIAART